MQVILRTPVKFAQLAPGDTFGCGLRSAPFVLLKDTRGCAVVLQNGEVVEPSPDEVCLPLSGVFIEGGSIVGQQAQARVGVDAKGNVSAELRGTIGPPKP